MKYLISVILTCVFSTTMYAQQQYYDVTANHGHGLRFWSNNAYKIHMGNYAEYHYGPVTDYSIKTNMSSDVGRGWTWGTTGQTPIAALSNVGNFQIAGSFYSLGNVGIGTTSPSSTLEVVGDVSMTGNLVTGTSLLLTGSTNRKLSGISSSGHHTVSVKGQWDELLIKGRVIDWSGSNLHIGYANDHSSNYIEMGRNTGHVRFMSGGGGNETMRITSDNRVGIGTTTPDEKLTVKGKIHTEEVRVDLSVPGPDYVFESDYNLPTLESIEKFIKSEKHLPEVPSAKEMEANGVELGTMNMLLLKKIEELTLYTLEQQKQLDSQQKLIVELLEDKK